MHRARMLRMVGMVVRVKEIMTVFVDVRECPVLILSVPLIMRMAMKVLIMVFVGIFGVVMAVSVRNLMAVVMVVMMMFMIVRVITVVGMITPFMRMISAGFFHLPFLCICNE
jgi:hypothetical protein